MRRRSGFTLIEMMIVLAIIAALAATLVPIAMNALNQAKVTANLTDLESIRLAQMQYYYKNGEVGTTAASLDVYLTWDNLTKTNLSGDYAISAITYQSVDAMQVQFTLANESLAKAFEAQFTNTVDAILTDRTGGQITVAYPYK